MYIWLLAALHWLHILGGIFWFGSVLTGDFILLPTLRNLRAETVHLRSLTLTELAGFMVILGLMISMRFGY